MKNYQLKMPSNIYGGKDSINKVCEIITAEKTKEVIIFTDKGITNTGLIDLLVRQLELSSTPYKIFDNLATEPSYQDVDRIVAQSFDYKEPLVIAIGGGSVMDTAKLYTVLNGANYTVKDLLKDPALAKKTTKSLMIPTTCGTGSEATCNSIVGVPEEGVKVGIVNDQLIPDYVILDPQMIAELPKKLVASTGIDALSHCIECFTSNKANSFSNLYALVGGKLIMENIRKAYQNLDDMEARENLLLGAFYGGVAITSSGTTAVHALSYPLGGKYHIPHGISNAILFAHVMEFNKEACLDELSQVSDAINPSLYLASKDEKSDYIIDEIKNIVKITEIPSNLEQYGVTMKDVDFLSDAASKVKRLLNNNKKELTVDDIKKIYNKILS